MIDIKDFLSGLSRPLNDYAEPDQLIRKDQKMHPKDLKDNRIIYGVILFADTESRQTIISKSELIDSDTEFDHDIKRSYISTPRVSLSFNSFNAEGRIFLEKIREWFYTPNLGDIWLDDYDCVIKNVSEIQDRTVFLETDYEEKYGFDVQLQFVNVVEVRLDTIESVGVTINDISIEINKE